MIDANEFRGKRVTIMGLGRFGGGVGVTRWLAARGAQCLVTDQAPADTLASSIAEIADTNAKLRLGGHDERDFTDTDLVIANPAIPDSSPYLAAARRAGVPITTEINLFVQRCRGRCVGVTGSVGKSTTTAMIGHILERTYRDGRACVGGNLGRSLLGELDKIQSSDIVVLELSSFQLERTPLVRWSPHIAVLTNFSPNHLDWHGSYAAYVAAKLNIVRFQDPARDRIVISDRPELREPLEHMFGDLAGVWRACATERGAMARCQTTSAAEFDDQRITWEPLDLIAPGQHNRANAALALTVAELLDADRSTAVEVLRSFEGLDHRLRRVACIDGVSFYDDSKSTTPEAALTAMAAIDAPLLLILGGYDKGSDLSAMSATAAGRARLVACIGKTGATIQQQVRQAGGRAELFESLAEAVAACKAAAQPGDAVLLSPGCASWGMFEDYRQRGRQFEQLVLAG